MLIQNVDIIHCDTNGKFLIIIIFLIFLIFRTNHHHITAVMYLILIRHDNEIIFYFEVRKFK